MLRASIRWRVNTLITRRTAVRVYNCLRRMFAQATSFSFGFSPAVAASRTSRSRLKELIFPRLMSDTRAWVIAGTFAASV